jgi:hypothetical protein
MQSTTQLPTPEVEEFKKRWPKTDTIMCKLYGEKWQDFTRPNVFFFPTISSPSVDPYQVLQVMESIRALEEQLNIVNNLFLGLEETSGQLLQENVELNALLVKKEMVPLLEMTFRTTP